MKSFAANWCDDILAGRQGLDSIALVYAYQDFLAKKDRKTNGIYYTPEYIVDYIVKNTIGQKNIEATTKIIDMTCGSGVFLIYAYNYIVEIDNEKNLPINIKKIIIEQHIFGIDIDKNAVEVAKLALLICVLKGECEAIIENEIHNFLVNGFLSNNILVGNSLLNFDDFEHSFDIVIGNPPWVSLSGKFGNDILNEEAHQYLIQKYNGNAYRPNLYEYFVHRGLDLVKEDGLFSFIVPDRLGFNEQFVSLRKRILENYTIQELLYKANFPNIATDTLIFRFLHQKPTNDTTLMVGEFDKFVQNKLQVTYLDMKEYQFIYQQNIQYSNIIECIFNDIKNKSLGSIFETKVGVIVDTSQVTNERIDSNQKAILKGKGIGRYTIKNTFYITYIKENIKGGTNDVNKLGASEKVLLRKTGAPLYATYDNSGVFPEQSLYFIFNPKVALSLKYITALINSKLFNFVYMNVLITNKDSTPQIKKVDLDKFPVRLVDIGNDTEKKIYETIIKDVDMIMRLHEKLKGQLTQDRIAQWQERITYYENQINELVLDIYGITDITERNLMLHS